MKIKFKDVAHLFYGCKLFIVFSDLSKGEFELDAFWLSRIKRDFEDKHTKIKSCKPLLHPLPSMTDEEMFYNHELQTYHSTNRVTQKEMEAERTLWLLNKHFDLFNLIESCEALDITKQTITQ